MKKFHEVQELNKKMIGVQSCKHFGCQRSQPTFGHPSGASDQGGQFWSEVQFFCRALKQQYLTFEVTYLLTVVIDFRIKGLVRDFLTSFIKCGAKQLLKRTRVFCGVTLCWKCL